MRPILYILLFVLGGLSVATVATSQTIHAYPASLELEQADQT